MLFISGIIGNKAVKYKKFFVKDDKTNSFSNNNDYLEVIYILFSNETSECEKTRHNKAGSVAQDCIIDD